MMKDPNNWILLALIFIVCLLAGILLELMILNRTIGGGPIQF